MKSAMAMIFATLFSADCYAEPDKAQYELQERCGRRAGEVFKHDWPQPTVTDKNGVTVGNYVNHYNARLNKCFYLEVVTVASSDKAVGPSHIQRLFDINENRELGTFYQSDKSVGCDILGKHCSSIDEWGRLIRPYMNE